MNSLIGGAGAIDRPGVLNREQLIDLGKKGIIENLIERNVDGSALDLHLSPRGWKMKGSIKGMKDQSYYNILNEKRYGNEEIDLSQPYTLEKRNTYIVQLSETLHFNNHKKLYGKATGKSSIGRLDVLTRLIPDTLEGYDEVSSDYSGVLFLEITPLTFSIKVKAGISLHQLRIFKGDPKYSEIEENILKLYDPFIIPPPGESDKICDLKLNLEPVLIGGKKVLAFEAKEEVSSAIDLTQGKGTNNPKEYWNLISGNKELNIKKENFYILRSKERFMLPGDLAVYAQAISEVIGEIRIHYAGFIHPCFGCSREEGAPLTFEVRGHNVDVFLRDGEVFAKMNFFKMSEKQKPEKESYDKQELTLSNYFKKWDDS